MVDTVVLKAGRIKGRGRVCFAQAPIPDRPKGNHVLAVRRVGDRGLARPTSCRNCLMVRQCDAGQASAASQFQPLASIQIRSDHESLFLDPWTLLNLLAPMTGGSVRPP